MVSVEWNYVETNISRDKNIKMKNIHKSYNMIRLVFMITIVIENYWLINSALIYVYIYISVYHELNKILMNEELPYSSATFNP